jgi:glucose-6-phosphate 1-dehydrogenase
MSTNSTLVLFGAKGNLSRIKLIPSLFHLDEAGKLPEEMKILSVGRQTVSQEEWVAKIKGMLDTKFNNKYDLKVFDRFIKRNIYRSCWCKRYRTLYQSFLVSKRCGKR